MTRSPLTTLDYVMIALTAFLLWNMPALFDMADASKYAPDVCAPFSQHRVACP